jgi:hypothetical protein
MKTVYQKYLKGTNINIVTENFQESYPGITIEIGGPLRYTDPTIWCFQSPVQCDHFIRRIFYAAGMKEALKLLNEEISRIKRKSPEAQNLLQKLENDITYEMLHMVGYHSYDNNSIIRMKELCGVSYRVAVHEKIMLFFYGKTRENMCYTCCHAKPGNEGWLVCDRILHAIPNAEIRYLPDILGPTTNGLSMDKDGTLYSNFCLHSVHTCPQYKQRFTPKSILLDAFHP